MTKVVRGAALALVLAIALGSAKVDFATAQDKKGKDKGKDAAVAAAKFEIYKDKGGKFRFRFYNSEGDEVAMTVRGYENKADLIKIVDAIKRDAGKAKIEEAK
jgi:uncharacterized protein YegP (UPF0339 family)